MSQHNFESGFSYYADHIPSGEEWYLIGIDIKKGNVCAAGYPPSIGKISDCKNFIKNKPLTTQELNHRSKQFGENWI